tara:strand:- start:33 stop:878 length:846 start_codon:yes stop_codon:yes gene_type:complete
MNPLKFKKHRNGKIFEYHFYPKDDELIIGFKDHFGNNEKLWKNWCDSKGNETFDKFNITNTTTVENILLYMLLIWELSKGKELLGTGIWETDNIRTILKRIPKLVNWEYLLKHECIIENKYEKENIGYKKAESPVITQYGKPINETPINKTGIFKIKTFNELSDFLKAGFSDSSNLSNFYITNNIKHTTVKLQSKNKPTLETLLNNRDIFLSLLIGQDPGEYDYLFLSSKVDLTEKIRPIIEKINKFSEYYISNIKTVKSSKEMIEIIEKGIEKYALQHRI